MNFEIQDNDDVLFDRLVDRLVDGELSADERRRLIASFDDPSLDGPRNVWRRCALAFLESQSWSGAMRQMVRPPGMDAKPGPVCEVTSAALPASANQQRRASRAGAWLAAAAAVLVAFSAGWGMNVRQKSGDAELVVDAGKSGVASDTAARPDVLADPLPDADSITLVVHDANGQPRRVQVPLVEGRRLGEQFGASPQWAAPEIHRQFAEQGLDLQARRRYAPLYFEQKDGIVPMVVPVDDAVVTPVSRVVY